MPITLNQDFVSGNEACLKWTISSDLINLTSKCLIYLSDINQSGVNTFSTVKYVINSNETLLGSHTFTNLNAGNYTAQISIMTNNTFINSEPVPVTVYQVDAPVFQSNPNGVISSNEKFTINLSPPVSDMTDGRVAFILYGQRILGGDTQNIFSGIVNKVFPYALDNRYIIEALENNSEYEITGFYTNKFNISGPLSEAKLERPTNAPNQITQLAPVYNATAQTLTITHNLPNNAADYDLTDLRATIRNISTGEQTFYFSSENSAKLSPAPTAESNIVFNMENKGLLPEDVQFTITLSAKNEVGLWGPESPAIKCIYTKDFSAVPLTVDDLNFVVNLDNIAISDKNTYVKNTAYDINYTASVYNSDAAGNIVGLALYTKTQKNNMNFAFPNLVTGDMLKVIINLNYTFTFSDATTVTIEQKTMNTCSYIFIPHDNAAGLTLSATPSDQSVLVSWQAINNLELKGFILAHYEVSHDNINWTNKGTSLSHNFTVGLTNGTQQTFYARAVSKSGTTLYMSEKTIDGETTSVNAIPYGAPSNLTKVSQLPEHEKCTIVWTISATNTYNGGLFDSFEANVNSNNSFVPFEPSFANGQYTHTFFGLTNLNTNSILIRLRNKNQTNLNNVNTTKTSDTLSISTIPFSLPAVPANFAADPFTMSVKLDWDGVAPASIINNPVKYEVHYKLQSNSVFTVVSNIENNSYEVPSLTSNSIYDFKIRSSIFNTEVQTTFYSDFTSILSRRPFVHLNAPNMVLEAGNRTITVKLTPNSQNFFQSKFNYFATLSNLDGSDAITTNRMNITTSDVTEITFTVLGDGNNLVNLTDYNIVAYYQTYNTDNNKFYSSNTVSSTIQPFDGTLTPSLSSKSYSTYVSYTFGIAAFSGYTIVSHQYSYDNINWNNITSFSSQTQTEISFVLEHLQNGTLYEVSVRINYEVNGEQKTSNVSNRVKNIPFTNSTAPINLTTVPSDKQIILIWEQPDDLGGLGLKNYEVKRNYPENAEGNKNPDIWTNVGTSLTYTFHPLTNAELYTLHVRAKTLNVLEGNAEITGASASTSNRPYTKPSPPTFVSCDQLNGGLRLTWSINTTGGILEGFEFVKFMGSYDGGINWINLSSDATNYVHSEQTPSYLFTGLTNGNPYTLKVYAVIKHDILNINVDGNILSQGPFTPYDKPSAPIFDSCIEGDGQLNVKWSAPASLGGLPINYYKVRVNEAAWINAGVNPSVDNPLGSIRSFIIPQLTNGASHTISIQVFTLHPNLDTIEGEIFTSTGRFYPYGNAIAPTFNSSSTLSSNNSSTLKVILNKLPGIFNDNIWEETTGTNTGGLNVGEYQYSLDNINWESIDPSDSSTFTVGSTLDGISFQASDIGTLKTIRVRVACIHPNLGLIPGASFVRDALIWATPSKPVTTTNVAGDKTLTISWQPMVPYASGLLNVDGVLNGLPLLKYQVSAIFNGDATAWTDVSASATEYTFPITLENGQGYSPVIRAIGTDEYKNVSGSGIETEAAGAVATYSVNYPYAKAAASTLNAINQQDGQLTLTWNKPTFNGLPFVRYEMSDGTNSYISTGNANYTHSETSPSFIFKNLTNGTNYNLSVTAITQHPLLNEIIGHTFTSLSYTPYKVAAAPVITATPGDQQILLEWATPDLGGLPLGSFQVSYDNEVNWEDLITKTGVEFSTNNINSSARFLGLANGNTFNYHIRAKTTHPNLIFISGVSRSVSSIPFVKPSVVSNIVAQANNNLLSFSFTPPVNSNNNKVLEEYEYSINGGISYISMSQLTTLLISINDGEFSLHIRAFINNPNYDNPKVKVDGDVVALYNLQNSDITSPQDLKLTSGNGNITLNWQPLTGATFQVLQYFANGSVFKDTTTASTYTFNDLENGTVYNFGVNILADGMPGPVAKISGRSMTTARIIGIPTKGSSTLTVNLDFGGSTTVTIDLLAASSSGSTINSTTRKTTNTTNTSVTFTGLTGFTFFSFVLSNSAGTVSSTYTL